MIVAIVDKRIVAHADTVTECAELMLSRALGVGPVRYRVAPVWLQSLAERGKPLDTFTVVVSGDDVTAEDDDIRRIREHIIARAPEEHEMSPQESQRAMYQGFLEEAGKRRETIRGMIREHEASASWLRTKESIETELIGRYQAKLAELSIA